MNCFTGAVMALHYQTFTEMTKMPLLPWRMEAARLARRQLSAVLDLVGADDFRFFHKVSPAKVFELCPITSIPLGYDDPDTKHRFSSRIIDLYHASRKETKNGGELVPTSTVLMSSNIPPIDQQR